MIRQFSRLNSFLIKKQIRKNIPRHYTQVFRSDNLNQNLMNQDYRLPEVKQTSDLLTNPVIQEILSATMLDSPVTRLQTPKLRNQARELELEKKWLTFFEAMRLRYKEAFISNGAYSESNGNALVRKNVARMIEARDGEAVDWRNVFLSEGASFGFQSVLTALLNPGDGVMMPEPWFEDFCQIVVNTGGKVFNYNVDAHTWFDNGDIKNTLESSFQTAEKTGVRPKILFVANPHSPTNILLSQSQILQILQFCKEKQMALLVDEGYQEINLKPDEFVSFKRELSRNKKEYIDVNLFSFNSISRGVFPSNLRCGYFEMVNVDEEVQAQIYKLFSMMLCGNTMGQIMMDLQVNLTNYLEAEPELSRISQEYKSYNTEKLESIEKKIRLALESSGKFTVESGRNHSHWMLGKLKPQFLNQEQTIMTALNENFKEIDIDNGSLVGAPGHIRFGGLKELNNSDIKAFTESVGNL